MTTLILFIVISLTLGLGLSSHHHQLVQTSTIEIPTHDPPMSHDAKLNGTRMLDYQGNKELAIEIIPWYNYTIMTDISDYEDCITSTTEDAKSFDAMMEMTANNETESNRVISLPPDEQRAWVLNHCMAVIQIGNVMEEAFEGGFS